MSSYLSGLARPVDKWIAMQFRVTRRKIAIPYTCPGNSTTVSIKIVAVQGGLIQIGVSNLRQKRRRISLGALILHINFFQRTIMTLLKRNCRETAQELRLAWSSAPIKSKWSL